MKDLYVGILIELYSSISRSELRHLCARFRHASANRGITDTNAFDPIHQYFIW